MSNECEWIIHKALFLRFYTTWVIYKHGYIVVVVVVFYLIWKHIYYLLVDGVFMHSERCARVGVGPPSPQSFIYACAAHKASSQIVSFVADTKSGANTAAQCRLDPPTCLLAISHSAIPDGFRTLDLSKRKATCRLCASSLSERACTSWSTFRMGRLFGFALEDFKSSGF